MSENRSDANPQHFAIRRIPASSSHWRQTPPESTSGNYRDSSNELSIDLVEIHPKERLDEVREIYKSFISEKGIGLAFAQVSDVNSALQTGVVEGKHNGKPVEEGKVLNDPIDGNARHGIITGKDSKNKGKLIQSSFQIALEPDKNFFK